MPGDMEMPDAPPIKKESVTAVEPLSMGPEPLIRMNLGVYHARFTKRHWVTIPGLNNTDSTKSLIINTMLLDPLVHRLKLLSNGYAPSNIRCSFKWPSPGCFPFCKFNKLDVHLSRFVPAIKTTGGNATVNDMTLFQTSPYLLVAQGHRGFKGQYQVDTKEYTAQKLMETNCLPCTDADIDMWPVVNTLGIGGEFHFSKTFPCPPTRYYYQNPPNLFHNNKTIRYLPHDEVANKNVITSYMGNFMPNYQPPAHDDVCLAIAMPRLHVLDKSTNKTNVYGSCIIETCLDVTFFTCPDHYIEGNPNAPSVTGQAIPLKEWVGD